MSMMCPPHSVKIVSTPSLLSALATRCPPDTTLASRLFCCSVSSAVVDAGRSRTAVATDMLDSCRLTLFGWCEFAQNPARRFSPGHLAQAASAATESAFSASGWLRVSVANQRARIGFRTARARIAATALNPIATQNTATQPWVPARNAASGTSRAAVPLAVYSKPALDAAYLDPKVSPWVAGNRL